MYDWAAGKSVRAVEAENNGLQVASKLARRIRTIGGRYRRCSAADVAASLGATEWHHTSKFFNKVNYYDFRDLGQLENRQMLREAIAARLAAVAAQVAWGGRAAAFKIEAAKRGACVFFEHADYVGAAMAGCNLTNGCIGEYAKSWKYPFWK